MIVSCAVRDIVGMGILALTPLERWSAARNPRGGDGSVYASQYGLFLLVATVALVFLILLLWWVSHRQKARRGGLTRELFAENAKRRGLSPRERQILLAIAMRSGLGQSHDIFATASAFEQGAGKLLAECVRTRTAGENERLKSEVTLLAEKLGFQWRRTSPRPQGSRVSGSRDILVGKPVALLPHHSYAGTPIVGEVVRNDAIDLAVTLQAPVQTQAGDSWRVRYNSGMSVWEFDTTVVSCDRTRLVLDHVERVRFVNRRRFPRVAVTMPAMVARFPFMMKQRPGEAAEAGDGRGVDDLSRASLVGPQFVHGVVTELAGPGLRIEVPLDVQVGDRVLVVFQLSEITVAGVKMSRDADEAHVVEDLGVIQHARSIESGMSVAVELAGVNDTDVDELVRITNLIASKVSSGSDEDDDQTLEMTVGTAAGQEI